MTSDTQHKERKLELSFNIAEEGPTPGFVEKRIEATPTGLKSSES